MLKVMETQIIAGNYRIRDALNQLHVLYVDVSTNMEFAKMLQNVNTVEEYQKLVNNSRYREI